MKASEVRIGKSYKFNTVLGTIIGTITEMQHSELETTIFYRPNNPGSDYDKWARPSSVRDEAPAGSYINDEGQIEYV